ncbi:MAG TPA: hypothetical protein VM186_10080 [Planctomycetota bacterium]|nr:hypothetical protein [Planctomycetota bacterium]
MQQLADDGLADFDPQLLAGDADGLAAPAIGRALGADQPSVVAVARRIREPCRIGALHRIARHQRHWLGRGRPLRQAETGRT